MTIAPEKTELEPGRVVAIAGPVVDVEFPPHSLPEINHAVEFDIDLDGVVDLGQRVRRELHVHDRSGDRDDAPRLERGLFWSDGHLFLTFPSGALRRRPRFP